MAAKKGVSKKIVETILKEKGIDYSEWLAEKHLEVLNENEDILSEIPKEDIQKMEETLIKIRDHFKEKNEEVCL